MEVLWWIALSLSLVLASFAISVAITAQSRLKELHRKLESPSMRSLHELEAAVAACESTCSSLSTTLRRLSSRIGMQDMRARRAQASVLESEMPTDPAAKKAWLRTQLAKGKLRVVKDREQGARGTDDDAA